MKKTKKEIELKIINLYINDSLSTVEISKIVNLSPTAISNIIKRNGYKTRSISDSRIGRGRVSKLPEEKIINLYTEERKSSIEISKIVNCSKRSVLNVLKNNNIEARSSNHEFYNKEHAKMHEIKKLYIVENFSMKIISEKLNLSYSTVRYILNKLNIIRTEDKYIGMSGKKRSKQTKDKVRKTRKKRKESGLYDHIYLQRTGYTYDEFQKILPEIKKYKQKVRVVTESQPIEILENYNKRGRFDLDDAYHLDHKYSIAEGFKNNIDPEIIGNIANLEMIPWYLNLIKQSDCSITIEELNKLYYKDN